MAICEVPALNMPCLSLCASHPLRIEEIFGRPRQELYDRADTRIDSAHPQDRYGVLNVLEKSMQRVVTVMEYRLRRPDGSVRWIHARSFRVEDSQGKLCRIGGIAEDITDRKRALEEMKAAKAAAKAANRAKCEFLTSGIWCQV